MTINANLIATNRNYVLLVAIKLQSIAMNCNQMPLLAINGNLMAVKWLLMTMQLSFIGIDDHQCQWQSNCHYWLVTFSGN